MNVSELKAGDYVKENGSNTIMKVIEAKHEWQSGYDFVVIFDDLMGESRRLIDLPNYKKVLNAKK